MDDGAADEKVALFRGTVHRLPHGSKRRWPILGFIASAFGGLGASLISDRDFFQLPF